MFTVFFDFDGVIADSTEAVLAAYNEIAKKKKVPFLSKEDYLNKTSKEIFQHLKIRWYEAYFYLKFARKIVYENREKINVCQNIQKLLTSPINKPIQFVILSSNTTKLISYFTKKHFPQTQFLEIVGEASMFAKHRSIKKMQKKLNLSPMDYVYVGDEERDIRASKKVGVRSIAVLWGKESPEILRRNHPDFLVKNGEELYRVIESLS